MQVRIVPYADVAADAEEVKNIQDASTTSSCLKRFNTPHRHLDEILAIVPQSTSFKHEQPPWTPYGYTIWQPLIARGQNLRDGDSHITCIPSFLCEDLTRCHAAWISAGRIRTSLVTDVVESWVATKSGKKLNALFDGNKKWFIKLDQMSPKDSPLGGKLPSTTLEEVVAKLSSSMRAYGCLLREREDADAEGREMSMKLVVNAWDEDMDAAREFRVFVPPPLARLQDRSFDSLRNQDLSISAISQYRWPFAFQPPYTGLSLEETAGRLYAGAQNVLEEILEFAEKEVDGTIRDLLFKYGFSFDVIVKEGGSVQLVEINPFGALSGCGACLFNWKIDGRVLYGLEGVGEEGVFAVTVE